MNQKSASAFAAFFLVFSMFSAMAKEPSSPKGMESLKNNLPFLILGKMPHLTGPLMQLWESPEMKLTDDQKEKLLVVRKNTMAGITRLGKEIGQLEQRVVKGVSEGKAPKELKEIVQAVAAAKAEATMLHLRCIHETRQILDPRQFDLLKRATQR